MIVIALRPVSTSKSAPQDRVIAQRRGVRA